MSYQFTVIRYNSIDCTTYTTYKGDLESLKSQLGLDKDCVLDNGTMIEPRMVLIKEPKTIGSFIESLNRKTKILFKQWPSKRPVYALGV